MNVFRRLVFTAVIAGFFTGGLIAIAHYFGTASLIARAEMFEKAAEATPVAQVHSHAGTGVAPHTHDAGSAAEWEPQDGIERTFYTTLADIVTAIAFSLVLVAALELRGRDVDWRAGLYWGLAGFAAFTLAPGLGLPPEVPGTAAAPLAARQVWWVLTAAATAGGVSLLLLQRRAVGVLLGVVLLAAPHIYGAPQPSEYSSVAPEGLAHDFRVMATLTSLAFWMVLGTSAGAVYRRMKSASPKPAMLGRAIQGP